LGERTSKFPSLKVSGNLNQLELVEDQYTRRQEYELNELNDKGQVGRRLLPFIPQWTFCR